MSFILTILVFAACIVVFSSFGRSLSARKSLLWILIFLFLIAVSLAPYSLLPLANLLGVQVPSNLFFAIMVVFLLMNSFVEASTTTELQRKMRDSVSFFAAQKYLDQNKSRGEVDTLIVVPCFNEERVIKRVGEDVLSRFDDLRFAGFRPALVIVNDASRDRTQRVLNEHFPSDSTQHSHNIGVSGVLNTGFKIARSLGAKFVVQFDGDGQHPAERIVDLLKAASQSQTDLLIGSRYVKSSGWEHASTTRSRVLGSRLIVTMLKIFRSTGQITDPTSGFRVYSQRAIEVLMTELPEDYPEPESIAICSNHRLKISEVLVDMKAREEGESSLSGLSSLRFMLKVSAALLGLRLRSLFDKIWS